MQPVEFFSTMNHSEVQLVMFSLIGRLFSSKVRCVLVFVQPCTATFSDLSPRRSKPVASYSQ